MADGPVDEPAEVAGIKFASRALLAVLWRTVLDLPAGQRILVFSRFHEENEEQLPFNIGGNLPPTLFEALNGFEREPQDLRKLLLCFPEFLANEPDVFMIHCQARLFGHLRPEASGPSF